jgi:hypothetical protein
MFIGEFLRRTTSVFDHLEPLNYSNDWMLSYLGYPSVYNPNPGWPDTIDCGPPNTGCYDGHEGYDFSRSTTGEAAYAAAPGEVVFAGWNGSYGNTVEIDHGHGFTTLYGHLDSISVTVGTTVTLDTQVGIIGSTGFAAGAHLHFGVYHNGTYFDPSGWLDTVDDPWAHDDSGTVSYELWQHRAPWPEEWGVEGAVGGTFTSASGSTVIDIPAGAVTGYWDFTLTDIPVAEPSASLEPIGNSFFLIDKPLKDCII